MNEQGNFGDFKEASSWQRQLCIALLPLLAGLNLLAGVVFVPRALRGNADFRQFYAGGYMLRVGMRYELYDQSAQRQVENRVVSPTRQVLPINHPAYEYLIFVPLSVLPYKEAYLIWGAINLGLMVFCAVKFAYLINDKWLAASLFLGFAPVWAAVMQGQDSVLVLLFCLLSLTSADELAAGSFLGLTAFRFHLLVPLLVLYALWRQWRFLKGALLTGMAGAVLSVWLVGVQGSILYVTSAAALTSLTKGLPVNVYGLALAIFGPRHSTVALLVACICATVAIAYASGQKPSLGTALLLVPLASYYLMLHELVVLLIPIGLKMRRNFSAVLQLVVPAFGFSPLAFVSGAPAALMLFWPERQLIEAAKNSQHARTA